MTTPFKPGHHPDADQLSAFTEQALPAHERDGVLAHLAVCRDCRAVVALALPEEETVAQPAVVPARSLFSGPWFSNWMVFVPAAAAVAALAAFIFFVHHQARVPQQQAQIAPAPSPVAPPQLQPSPTVQTKAATLGRKAIATMPAPPPPSPQAVAAVASGASGAGIVSGRLQSAPIESARPSAAPQAVVIQSESIQSLPAQNPVNSFVSASNNAVAGENQPAQQAAAPRSTFHGGAIGGLTQTNSNLPQSEANVQNGQQLNGLQQNNQQRTANQTVQVQAEAPVLDTTNTAQVNAVIAGRATANFSFVRQPIPSGLPLLSSAERGPIVLAIDTHHSVFVSNDSGQHWKTVRAVWKGRAVRVDAAAPARILALPVSGASMGASVALPQGAAVAKQGGVALTGTVTDQSGAVVPGVTVTVSDSQRGLKRSITTDANGGYVVAGLEPGNYDVDATARGFMSSHLSGVAVAASKASVVDFTLRVGAASETVTVEASRPSIEVEDATELKTIPEPRTSPGVKAAPMDKAKPTLAPLFEIVTDKGVHWTSADGLSWQPK
jgi:hypothetical protein